MMPNGAGQAVCSKVYTFLLRSHRPPILLYCSFPHLKQKYVAFALLMTLELITPLGEAVVVLPRPLKMTPP